MATATKYVPALKNKQGEMQALGRLGASTKDGTYPLIRVSPNQDDAAASRALSFAKRLGPRWSGGRPVMIDTSYVDDAGEKPATVTVHFVQAVFDALDAEGLSAVPVITPVTPTDHHPILQTVAARGLGAAIRVVPEDFDPSTFHAEVAAMLAVLGLPEDKVDFVLDMEETPRPPAVGKASALAFLSMIPNVNAWRSLVFLSGGFPESLTDVSSGSAATFPRVDYDLWLAVDAAFPARQLSYGDYTVVPPGTEEPEFTGRPNIAPKIRYCTATEWEVEKAFGMFTKGKGGAGQYKGLAQTVTTAAYFMGATHCDVCDALVKVAAGKHSVGNATTWIERDVAHHITVAESQAP